MIDKICSIICVLAFLVSLDVVVSEWKYLNPKWWRVFWVGTLLGTFAYTVAEFYIAWA